MIDTPTVKELEELVNPTSAEQPEKDQRKTCNGINRTTGHVACSKLAIAWTFWRCSVCGSLRFQHCLDHVVEISQTPDKRWLHCDVTGCVYLGHAPL